MEKENLRLIFMGTPRISAFVFESLIEAGYHFVGLIAQPDRPIGRSNEAEKVPTKIIAEKYGIPVFQPIKIRKEYEFVKELRPDLIITLAYGQIVPQGLLDIPQYGCLNLHGSLLPKYRGAAPIQYALINNEKETGMTLMEMIDKMDAGRMYAKHIVEINPEDNATSLFKKMGIAAKDLILDSLPKYIDGELGGEAQDESLVTFAPSIKVEQEKLDLSMDAEKVLGWIRALSDKPGGYLLLDGEKVKIYRAELIKIPFKGQIGEVIQANKNGLVIQLNDGQLSLLEVQKQGKKRMDFRSFVNGSQKLFGKIFE